MDVVNPVIGIGSNSVYSDPHSLLRLLHRVAIVSTILILILSASGIYWVYERYIISNAEAAAVSISEVIVALEKKQLLRPLPDGGSRLVINESVVAGLDQRLKLFNKPYNILKIKLFSPAGEVIYSTDRATIGQLNPDNQRLANALLGNNDSALQTKEELVDSYNEKHFDVDVVETYVPIRNERGEVVGSFEIYQDTTQYRQETIRGVLLSVVIMAMVLAVVFSIGYYFARMAVNRLSQAQQQLLQLATEDGLTQLLNNREIMRLAENEFSRFLRIGHSSEKSPFSLIMADIDNFKQINDQNGHQCGDEVLREVANRLNLQMRRYSVVGRYGGEEFLVILPQADADEVQAIAERIRGVIEERPVTVNDVAIEVTLSLGVATVNAADCALAEVLSRADKGLYRAKSLGKNQVCGSSLTSLCVDG